MKVRSFCKPTDEKIHICHVFYVVNHLLLALSLLNDVEIYKSSHQKGHVLAALYSAKKLDIIDEKFVAFHVSGGTTDCLCVNLQKKKL